jgi:hypothetical protein
VSPYKSPATGYLVVEGFIAANGLTRFSLSRTIGLPGDSAIPLVTGATVQVEGSDSSVFTLPEEGAGMYGDTSLSLNATLQYRLLIHTPDGGSYLSDFVPVRPTPPIDSVNWVYSPTNGVTIYVNTHDPNNATHYYRWTYDQTWQYNMADESLDIYNADSNTVVPRKPGQFVYSCWRDVTSTNLIIDNTSRLAQDIVYAYPLVSIANNTEPLSCLYSIEVTQYGLTSDAYSYLELMQKNTESLGSIFDVLPSGLTGNIHCLSNPGEQVIGYISAGAIQRQRIFISYNQLPYWEYYVSCVNPNYLVPDIPDSLEYYFHYGGYVPLGQAIGGYTANQADCIDCTTLGGTNKKPSFWPN